MSIAMRGLKLKRNYGDLINAAVSDKLYNIRFPNRDASFKKWFYSVTIRWGRDENDGKTARYCQ